MSSLSLAEELPFRDLCGDCLYPLIAVPSRRNGHLERELVRKPEEGCGSIETCYFNSIFLYSLYHMACHTYVLKSQLGLCLPDEFPIPDYEKTHTSDNCWETIQKKLHSNARVLQRMAQENELLGRAARNKWQ